MAKSQTRNPHAHRWPEGAIVYHVYLRSLQDSNGDGIGDLPGIVQRLDYIASLGTNAVWLSPFYTSPMVDSGYDIADHCDVDPLFGTLSDFKHLLAEAHGKRLKVIIDLVPNHTSDEHEWFIQSRSSKDNPRASWYIWKDARARQEDGTPIPPNNWRSALTGGSAWEWDETREQFYLHSFDVKQPDLNWGNTAVREAMKDVMRFWLNLGVDGFRVDAVYWMAKDPLFRDDSMSLDFVEDEDPIYEALAHNNSRGKPAVYARLTEMASVLKEEKYQLLKPFMVTEAYPERHNPVAAYMAFYEGTDPTVAAPFNFEGVALPWDASSWHRFLKTFHTTLREFDPKSVASYAFGNHDKPRLVSRLGADAARSAAMMLLTLPGMAFIYYGEELGMQDVAIPPEQVRDPAAQGDPKHRGREPARTPMQWTDGKNAGFSTADHTWLPVDPAYRQQNVAAQSADPDSFLSLYRTLGSLRNSSPALRYGTIEILETGERDVLAYLRVHKDDNRRYVVLINFSGETVTCRPGFVLRELLFSSNLQTKLAHVAKGEVKLLPHEAALFVQ